MQQHIHVPGQPEAVADRVFVRQALAGDEGAFEALVRRYHRQIFQFIHCYVRDNDQAWDIFQKVLLKLFVSLPKLCVEQEQLGPWLYHIAHNCCIGAHRVGRLVHFSGLEWGTGEDGEELFPLASFVDPSPSPEEMVERHEVQRGLCEAIAGLPARMRPVVYLRYTDQLSFTEIGQRLKIPTTTAKSYFYRARPLLRATLTAQGQTDPPAEEGSGSRLSRKRA